jgi:hypothetical protein
MSLVILMISCVLKTRMIVNALFRVYGGVICVASEPGVRYQ